MGYRLMAEFGQGKCLLKTCAGANSINWFPEITGPLSNIRLFPEGPYIVDGEVCVIDEQGRSDFGRLHARAKHRGWYGGCDAVTFCVFDLLTASGVDQTQCPYLERKERLQRLFKPAPPGVMYVGQFESDGELLFQGAVLPLELEGLVAKKVDSPYVPGVRSSDWVKVKRKFAIPAQRFDRKPSVPYATSRSPMIEPEDDVLQCLPPDTAEPIEVYTASAVRHGLIRPGDNLDDNMIELMAELVGLCAIVGDA